MRAGLLSLFGIVTLACWWGLAGGDLSDQGIPRFWVLYFAAAASYVLALVTVALRRSEPVSPRLLWGVLAAAVVFRLVLLPTEPDLSQDCWRYVWEGRVQAEDVNPYQLAPDDPQLEPLRDEVWENVNHRDVPAIYGPLLEALFALLALLPGGLLPFKLAFLAADAAIVALVLRALRRARASPLWVVAYAWHPLPILEVAGQAHLELVPVALLLAAVELETTRRRRLASLVLGLSIAAKYLPVLLIPAFLRAPRSWHARAQRLVWILLPGLILTLPYLTAGLGDGLSAYGQSWRFNDGGFWVVDRALEVSGVSAAFCRSLLPVFVTVDPGFDPAEHSTWMRIPAKLFVGLLVAGVLGALAWRRASPRSSAFAAGALFLAFSPTVHPWYALWILPFLALPLPAAPHALAWRGAWLWLSLSLPLAYQATVGVWHEEPWVRALEYLPALGLGLLAAGLWARQTRLSPPATRL